MVDRWERFFVAEAGAAAVLAGLVFVGLSINLAKILAMPHLIGRAAEAMIVLMVVLFISAFLLVPAQPLPLVAVEMFGVGLAALAIVIRGQIRDWRIMQQTYRRYFGSRVVLSLIAVVPFVVAGLVMLLIGESGIYWIVPGVVGSFLVDILDVWVLLVEINR